MKLSWKLFFITTPIFLLFLTFFGVWMIQDSFQSSLNQEIDRCKVENQMFQNSYELTVHSLSEEQREQTSLKKLIKSFHRNNQNGSIRILNAEGTVLYQEHELQALHGIREALSEQKNVGYELFQENGEHYVAVMSLTSFGEYIETVRNITTVFENRTRQYSGYQTGMLLVAGLTGVIILLVLVFVMRDMQKLSRATRQFARGQYQTRVKIHSRDEIGMLAADFNWMANEMNQQMEKLQNEVQRQEEFTAAFAHELKTPLTSIIGYADTIRQMELSPEETDMCANYIYHQGKRLQSLSYKLLDMAMADQRKIVWKPLAAVEVLEESVHLVKPMLDEKQIRLELQLQNGVIYGDKELLSAFFMNLIDNARKASEQGSMIRVTGSPVSGGYLLVVEDQGRGMTQEELSRITEAFYMADKSRSRKEGGAGLGLALCQKILDLHQGSWQFESEPGHGTRITVGLWTPQEIVQSRNRRLGIGRRNAVKQKGRSKQRETAGGEHDGA